MAAPEKSVTVLDLKIGGLDSHASSLVSMEMDDTQRTGFRRACNRKKSIDRIFGKMNRVDVEKVDKSKLKGLPRRSLANDLDLAAFCAQQESDDESDSRQDDDTCVHMLDLKVGEQDPRTNSLVALEMRDTQKTGFRRKSTRKKSIDRIFGKMKKVHIVHDFKSKLSGMPRRSLASNLNPAMFRDFNESDDDDGDAPPARTVDENSVRMLDLNIGETEPATKSLVALEMQDTQRTGFRKDCRRKKSIDRIFGKMGSVTVDRGVDERKLKSIPRRSLNADFDVAMLTQPSESDDEE